MDFLIGLGIGIVVVGLLFFLAFLASKAGVPNVNVYKNTPQKQIELTGKPLPSLWRILGKGRSYLRGRLILLVTLPGPIFLMLALLQITQVVGSSSWWPMATGTVTQSSAQPDVNGTGYTFGIRYQFTAHGTQVTGSQVAANTDRNATLSKEAASTLAQKYPVGSTVTVHYDSANPFNAVLESQVSANTVRLVWIGLILTVIGVPVFALYLRARRWVNLYNTVLAWQTQS